MLKQRMYSFVIYQLSGRQAGIQAGHATQEFSNMLGNSPEFKQWAYNDKTVVILNGGTTNDIGFDPYSKLPYKGSMQVIIENLDKNKIAYSTFQEPDLNNCTSAISLLVDERVWDWENYPDLSRELIYPLSASEPRKRNAEELFEEYKKLYGSKIAFLKTYLPTFNLANN